MKYAIILLFIIIPAFSFAQSKKESWFKQRRQKMLEEYSWKREKPLKFSSVKSGVGYHLQQAGQFLIIGAACEIVGAGTMALGSSSDSEATVTIVGGGIAVAGLILQIVGYVHINRAGSELRKGSKISFTGNSISFNF